MPPRQSQQSSFALADAGTEVVCPLHNQDGSQCRKRCLGEKRYRSMQEHIRRAHPEYYIPKLPATRESFELMISTPPSDRPQPDPNHANRSHNHIQQHSDPSGLSPGYNFDAGGLNHSFQGYNAFGQHDGGYYTASDTEHAIYNGMQVQQRAADELRRGSIIPDASAAAALAQLHYHRPDSEWGGEGIGQTYYGNNADLKHNDFHVDPALEDSTFMQDQTGFQGDLGQDQSGLIPNNLSRSTPDGLPRSATLPPLQRSASRSVNRPRKSSLSAQARIAKHERKRSKDLTKRMSGDRKTLSAEPGSAPSLHDKRWVELIEAASSAQEDEDSRDLTPIPGSPYQSPQVNSRTSLPPPFAMGSQFQSFQSFQASPLNRALTPPSGDQAGLDLQHYPSVDSSLSSNISHQHHNSTDSGSNFQIMNPSSMDSTSSPMFTPGGGGEQQQIYCAGCKRLAFLKESFACNQCICGLCNSCTDALISEQSRGRLSSCPRCNSTDSSFKAFQLELR